LQAFLQTSRRHQVRKWKWLRVLGPPSPRTEPDPRRWNVSAPPAKRRSSRPGEPTVPPADGRARRPAATVLRPSTRVHHDGLRQRRAMKLAHPAPHAPRRDYGHTAGGAQGNRLVSQGAFLNANPAILAPTPHANVVVYPSHAYADLRGLLESAERAARARLHAGHIFADRAGGQIRIQIRRPGPLGVTHIQRADCPGRADVDAVT
jgi:hypothetical protein